MTAREHLFCVALFAVVVLVAVVSLVQTPPRVWTCGAFGLKR